MRFEEGEEIFFLWFLEGASCQWASFLPRERNYFDHVKRWRILRGFHIGQREFISSASFRSLKF